MNETGAFSMQLCGTIPMIVPQSCVMNASVSFMLSSFSKYTMGRRQMKNSNCFKPACGGKVAYFENDTASEK